MKFLCSNCNAKYQIADEKIAGRTLRMKCRKCEHEIVLEGEGPRQSPSVAPPVPPEHVVVAKPTRPPPAVLPAGVQGRRRAGSGVGPLPQRPQAAAPRRGSSALGADFRKQVAHGPVDAPSRPPPAGLDQWHVAINDVPVGPIRRDELVRKIATGAVTAESLAWREGFDDWRPVAEIPELADLIRRSQPGRPRLSERAPGMGGRVPTPGPRKRTQSGSGHAVRTAAGEGARGEAAAARFNVVPIGGRLGATAAPMFDDVIDEVAGEYEEGATRSSAPPTSPVEFATPGMVPPAGAFGAAQSAEIGGAAVAAAGPAQQRRGFSAGALVGVGAGAFVMAMVVLVVTRLSPGPPNTREVVREIVRTVPAPAEAPRAGTATATTAPAAGEESPGRPHAAPRKSKQVAGTKGATATVPATPQAPGSQDQELLARYGGGLDSKVGVRTTAPGEQNVGPRRQPLDDQQVRTVVNRNKPSLQRCYEGAVRGMQEPPTVRVAVNLMVGESGAVTRVSATGGNLAQITTCIEGTVRRWRFPASEGGAETSFPVLFSPGGA